MAVGLARYGLDHNPYSEEELNPLKKPEHADQLVTCGSYGQLTDLDAVIADRVAERQSCIFLVVGRRGAGRTSVANSILARYMQHRGVDGDRFIVPVDQAEVGNHDDYSILLSWLVDLRECVEEAPFNLPSTVVDALREAQGASREVFTATLRAGAKRLARALREEQPPGAFGVCLENVKSPQQVSSILEIFSAVETAVVLTALDYESVLEEVVRPYSERMKAPLKEPVRLEPLGGREAQVVIDDRWRRHSSLRSPFDPEGVKKAFGSPQQPIGRVLRLAGGVLEVKSAGPGGLWPNAPDLALSETVLPQLVVNLMRDYG